MPNQLSKFEPIEYPNNLIYGSQILEKVKNKYTLNKFDLTKKMIGFIRFSQSLEINKSQYHAAEISTIEKLKIFRLLSIGVKYIHLPSHTSIEEFEEVICQLNSNPDVIGVLLQNPIPLHLKLSTHCLLPEKDLDGQTGLNSKFPICTTAEATQRVLLPFLDDQTKIAIVGAQGFIGKSLTKGLESKGIRIIKIDLNQSLNLVKEADIVVSATGQPELLTEEHLTINHRAIIDIGCTPVMVKQFEFRIIGDVKQSIYPSVRYITPVPGGMGPLSIATLLERIVETATDQTIDMWSYTPKKASL